MMDAEARKEGRTRVRQVLVARLQEAGLKPCRKQTAAAHEEMWGRLADQLAYMEPENLLTLADQVMALAEGPRHDQCPAEVTIRAVAHALQRPPFEEHRIVSSWLASVEGPVAEAGGYLVELYRWLRQHGRPPLTWDMKKIREQAAENNRQVTLLRDRGERGVIQPADREWLEAWAKDQQSARRIVREGQNRRAA